MTLLTDHQSSKRTNDEPRPVVRPSAAARSARWVASRAERDALERLELRYLAHLLGHAPTEEDAQLLPGIDLTGLP
jgi:hypothetical protein